MRNRNDDLHYIAIAAFFGLGGAALGILASAALAVLAK